MNEVMVIACYRPKPGKETALLELLPAHLPALRAEGLLGDGLALAGRAADGTIVEIFRWKSEAAIDAAHENPAVAALWERFAAVCDYVSIADVAGARDLFTPLEPLAI